MAIALRTAAPGLLERDGVLARLTAAYDDAVAGTGRLVLVAGEAGIGKTALVRRLCDELGPTVETLHGGCDPLQTPRPLGPFLDLAEAAPRLLAEAIEVGAVPHDIATALLAAANGAPLVAVLEDVHWVDEATLDVLRVLGRRIGDARALVIATYRDDELDRTHPLRLVLGELATAPGVVRIRVEPLSVGAVGQLASGHSVDVAALHRLTGGNPFFVTEVLAAGGAAIPETVRDAVLARVAQLGPSARAVVEAAYKHPSTLVSRLARRALVKSFGADPAAFPMREYLTKKTLSDYSAVAARAARPWVARVETEKGVFRIRLAGADAPLTVDNFLTLAEKKYFDGARVHRVVPGFVVQDGDPTGTGNVGPGWEIRDELGPATYRAGTVGMALSGPDTGGSQWFVTHSPQPHLDGIYTVFGQVISGMDVVSRIEQGDKILRVAVTEEPENSSPRN